jgi:hypothetical protein
VATLERYELALVATKLVDAVTTTLGQKKI